MSRSKRLLILLAVLAAACAAAFAALHWQHRQEQIQTSGQAVLEIDPRRRHIPRVDLRGHLAVLCPGRRRRLELPRG